MKCASHFYMQIKPIECNLSSQVSKPKQVSHKFLPVNTSTTTCTILITIKAPAKPVHNAGPHHFISLPQLRHSPAPVKCI